MVMKKATYIFKSKATLIQNLTTFDLDKRNDILSLANLWIFLIEIATAIIKLEFSI